jgi:hypothetical protein
MAARSTLNTVLIALAVLGAFVLVAWAFMSFMVGEMISGGMMGGMGDCCSGRSRGVMIGGLLVLAIIAAAVFWSIYRTRTSK